MTSLSTSQVFVFAYCSYQHYGRGRRKDFLSFLEELGVYVLLNAALHPAAWAPLVSIVVCLCVTSSQERLTLQ